MPVVLLVRTVVTSVTMAVTTVMSMPVSMTMSMPMPIVPAMMLMIVMSERTESDKCRQRRDVAVTVMRVGRCAGQRHHNQAGGCHDSKFIYPLLNHFRLQFALMTQPL